MTLDLSRPVQMRNGGQAIIHTTDGPDPDYPVVASICRQDKWYPASRTKEGYFYRDERKSDYDFINVPEPVDGWLVLDKYDNDEGRYIEGDLWTSKGIALAHVSSDSSFAIAHIRIHPNRPVEDMIEIVSVEPVDD